VQHSRIFSQLALQASSTGGDSVSPALHECTLPCHDLRGGEQSPKEVPEAEAEAEAALGPQAREHVSQPYLPAGQWLCLWPAEKQQRGHSRGTPALLLAQEGWQNRLGGLQRAGL
jgi:hypothetical protein